MAEADVISRHSSKWAQFNNSIAARLVDLGTWNVLRLGILWSIRQDSPITAIDPTVAFGFCSGTANTFGDASATHFVGLSMDKNTVWSVSGNFLDTDVLTPVKQVGAVLTSGTTLTGTNLVFANTTSSNVRSMTMLELTKGSPNYSFRAFRRSVATEADVTPEEFTAQMEAGAPSLTNHAFVGPQTLAVNEGVDGTLDAVSVYWSLTTSSMEISDIQVVRVS